MRPDGFAVHDIVEHLGPASVGDHHLTASFRRNFGRAQLCHHAACSEAGPFAAGKRENPLVQAFDGIDQLCVWVFVRIRVVEAINIGEQHKKVCPNGGRDVGG